MKHRPDQSSIVIYPHLTSSHPGSSHHRHQDHQFRRHIRPCNLERNTIRPNSVCLVIA